MQMVYVVVSHELEQGDDGDWYETGHINATAFKTRKLMEEFLRLADPLIRTDEFGLPVVS